MNIEDLKVNYKEMYLTMVRASEKAVRCLETEGNIFRAAEILVTAQRDCEEQYISGEE